MGDLAGAFVPGRDLEPAGGNIEGWERWLTGPVTRYDAAGDHHTMLAEPHVRALGEQLRTAIASAWRFGAEL